MSEKSFRDPVEDLIENSYWGLLEVIDSRLEKVPADKRHDITTLHFKLSDDTEDLTDLIVSRNGDDGMLPVELRGYSSDGDFMTANIHLRPEAATPAPTDYIEFAGAIYDHLGALETAEAAATVVTEVKL